MKLTATANYSNGLWIRKTTLIFAPQLTHTAARSLCDSWATCFPFLSSTPCHQSAQQIWSRDVTKFVFNNVWTSFSTNSKVVECFKRFVVECEFVEKSFATTDFLYTARSRLLPENAHNFSVKFNYLSLLNYSYWMCNIIFAQWCVTSGLSNWQPAGRIRPAGQVDPARKANL